MRREWIIFVVGVVIFFLPFLGFARVFNNALMIIAGLLLCALSLRQLRRGYVSELYDPVGKDKKEDEKDKNSP